MLFEEISHRGAAHVFRKVVCVDDIFDIVVVCVTGFLRRPFRPKQI